MFGLCSTIPCLASEMSAYHTCPQRCYTISGYVATLTRPLHPPLPLRVSNRPLPTSSRCMRQLQPLHRPRLACIQAASADGPEADPVDVAAKGEERQKLFNRIAPAYDELNDLLSLGQHRIWKRMAVGWSRASAGNSVLDVCCGSGDLALLLAGTVGPEGSVVGLDFAQNMLDYAATREREKVSCRRGCSIQWLKGDALAMPFQDAYFDAVTMGFGLRNITDIQQALREVLRVLHPGCSAAILDFNNSPNPIVDGFQNKSVKGCLSPMTQQDIGPHMGMMLEHIVVPAARQRGLAEEYEYLRPSIREFPHGPEQERLALEVGFQSAVHYEISFGLMGCLVATKRTAA